MTTDTHPAGATDLAVIRTALAYDRTLMAWIRTAFSMITFGFTLLKLVDYLEKSDPTEGGATKAHNLGSALILIGTLSMVGAMVQHWSALEHLKTQGYKPKISLALIAAVAVTVLGLLTFIGGFIRNFVL